MLATLLQVLSLSIVIPEKALLFFSACMSLMIMQTGEQDMQIVLLSRALQYWRNFQYLLQFLAAIEILCMVSW